MPDKFFQSFNFWKYLTNFWSIVYLAVVVADFFSANYFARILEPLSFMYIGMLAIYVSNKEFERWYDAHSGQHPGEWFVIVWSVVISAIVISQMFWIRSYSLPGSVISSYIAVLSILAITEKSKSLFKKKHRKK